MAESTPGGLSPGRFAVGNTIMLREVFDGRVRSVRPLRVVVDRDDLFAGFLVPDSKVAWPRLADGEQSQTPDQGWLLGDEHWFGPGSLYLIEPGEAYAAVLFFDRGTREPQGWKIDFFEPVRRTPIGFDTLDLALDLLADVDLTDIAVKDRDDFGQLRRTGQLDDAAIADVLGARDRAINRMERRVHPFDGQWTDWRPDETWQALELTPDWQTIELGPAAEFDDAPIARSAAGGIVLDDRGRTLHDLDLGHGQQVLGHAHPGVVEAVGRQLALGWPIASHRPGEARLRDLLAAWAADSADPSTVHLSSSSATARSFAEDHLAHRGPVLVLEPTDLLGGDEPIDDASPHVVELAAAIRADGGSVLLDWRDGAIPPTGVWADVAPDAIVVGEALSAGFPFGATIVSRAFDHDVAERNDIELDLHPLGTVAALEVIEHLDAGACDTIATTTAQLVGICRRQGGRVDAFANRVHATWPPRGWMADRGLHVGRTDWLTVGLETSSDTLERVAEALSQRVNEIHAHH